MKIVQIIPEFHLAGGQRMCEDLIYEIQKKGNDVVAISLFSHETEITKRLETTGIKIYYLNKKWGFDLSMPKAIYKVLKIEKPDVVHMHLYVAKYAVPAVLLCGVKCCIHTIHSLAYREDSKKERKLRKLFYKLNWVKPVALSQVVQDSVVEEYKLPANKVPVIYNGIDLNKCVKKENYNISGNFKILHIGRFCEVKNHFGLVNGFCEFHKKYPETELWLIGSGEEEEKIKELLTSLGIQNAVKFLGQQGNVYRFLGEADAFVLPSLVEGMPITLIEAMGSGLPILTTGVGGIADMVEDGKDAIFCSTDAKSIAEGFEKLYLNEDLRKNIGSNALKSSVIFSSEKMAENYIKIYNDAIV